MQKFSKNTFWNCHIISSSKIYIIPLSYLVFGQFFTLEGKIVADATIVAVWGNTILSMKTDNNSGGTHLKDNIVLCMKS